MQKLEKYEFRKDCKGRIRCKKERNIIMPRYKPKKRYCLEPSNKPDSEEQSVSLREREEIQEVPSPKVARRNPHQQKNVERQSE